MVLSSAVFHREPQRGTEINLINRFHQFKDIVFLFTSMPGPALLLWYIKWITGHLRRLKDFLRRPWVKQNGVNKLLTPFCFEGTRTLPTSFSLFGGGLLHAGFFAGLCPGFGGRRGLLHAGFFTRLGFDSCLGGCCLFCHFAPWGFYGGFGGGFAHAGFAFSRSGFSDGGRFGSYRV